MAFLSSSESLILSSQAAPGPGQPRRRAPDGQSKGRGENDAGRAFKSHEGCLLVMVRCFRLPGAASIAGALGLRSDFKLSAYRKEAM